MAKKIIFTFVLTILACGWAFAQGGAWWAVEDFSALTYINNMDEVSFSNDAYTIAYNRANSVLLHAPNMGSNINKLPKELIQVIWNKLRSYDLDVGDVFVFNTNRVPYGEVPFTCVALRIWVNANDWTFTFYAWQPR